jgi:hypothetical protein
MRSGLGRLLGDPAAAIAATGVGEPIARAGAIAATGVSKPIASTLAIAATGVSEPVARAGAIAATGVSLSVAGPGAIAATRVSLQDMPIAGRHAVTALARQRGAPEESKARRRRQ